MQFIFNTKYNIPDVYSNIAADGFGSSIASIFKSSLHSYFFEPLIDPNAYIVTHSVSGRHSTELDTFSLHPDYFSAKAYSLEKVL